MGGRDAYSQGSPCYAPAIPQPVLRAGHTEDANVSVSLKTQNATFIQLESENCGCEEEPECLVSLLLVLVSL